MGIRFAASYRPFVLEEVKGIVNDGDRVLETAREPDLNGTGPSIIEQRLLGNIARQLKRFKGSIPVSKRHEGDSTAATRDLGLRPESDVNRFQFNVAHAQRPVIRRDQRSKRWYCSKLAAVFEHRDLCS